ncbi:HalOD1 output domain-containing protein [Halorussus halophilus]|uniref:HalOD1 output domain-containing protein n=1 Tax=Halorussus halophilus TaxID=2650975 RepID=UPI00130176CF|nr:HalOD1 output domain-containing protein [Halorussus halophilus]
MQYDPGEEAYVTVHSDRDLEAVDSTIVEAVAAVTDSEPTEIPPLHNVIDPEALGELFAQPRRAEYRNRTEGAVTFRLAGCEVRFHADGRIVVTPPENE